MFITDHNTSRGLVYTLPLFYFPCLEINSQLMRSKATQIETGTARAIDKKRVYLTLNPPKKMQQGAIVKAKFIKNIKKRTKL